MAELPEIINIAAQMDAHLAGRKLTGLQFAIDKGLSHPAEEFEKSLIGHRLTGVRGHGKWLVLEFEGPGPNLLIHPGMGMDLLDLSREHKSPPYYTFRFGDRGFHLRHWWFGKLVLAQPGREKEAAGGLGPAPLSDEFTPDRLAELMAASPRRGLKAFLLDQKTIAGIGNYYVQDICFRVKAHPQTKLGDLKPAQRAGLHAAICDTLSQAVDRGLPGYELDFWGQNGGWGSDSFLIGYRTGQPCPDCGAKVEKIKAGATASYICPICQPEPGRKTKKRGRKK